MEKLSNNFPKVSVLMPVYNMERYLPQAIESIIEQTFTNYEFIIVDDGSTDRSPKFLLQYAKADTRIHLITKQNGGVANALNSGLDVVRGKYIARMDGDDISLPDRFEKQFSYMENHPECVALGGAAFNIDAEGELVNTMGALETNDEIVDGLLNGNGGAIIHPTLFFRRKVLLQIGGYNEEMELAEDYDFYLRLIDCGKLANLVEPLIKYRVYADSTSRMKDKQIKAKCAIKKKILQKAYKRRNLPWDDRIIKIKSFERQTKADFYRECACNSIRINTRRVALKHAVRACFFGPLEKRSWQVLRYILSKR